VAEGLKTLEVLLYYLSVVAVSLYKSIGLLWVVSRLSIIAEKIVKTACLKIQISSYHKEISSKISKNQLAQGLVTQYSSGYYYY